MPRLTRYLRILLPDEVTLYEMGITAAVELRIVENRGPLCAALPFPYCCHYCRRRIHVSGGQVKLNGISTGANKYTHPSYTQRPSGLYKVTVDTYGHVSAAAAVVKADITALGIPGTNTTYGVATQSVNGLMSAADKTKLDGMPVSGVYGEEF